MSQAVPVDPTGGDGRGPYFANPEILEDSLRPFALLGKKRRHVEVEPASLLQNLLPGLAQRVTGLTLTMPLAVR